MYIHIISTGVAQGSILGPLLFLLYINDIVNVCSDCRFILYAYDSTVLASHKDINVLICNLNRSLAQISSWFKTNELFLNISKTQCIRFKRKGVQQEIGNMSVKIDSDSLLFYDSVNFLGVTLTSTLSWKEHINSVCQKVSRFVGILNRLKYELPKSISFILYNSHVLSHLTYCNSIWGNIYSSHLQKLIVLQKKAIRICTGSTYRAPTSELFKPLKTLKLIDINKMQIASLMQRYHSQSLPPYFMNMFMINADVHTHYNRSCYHQIHRWSFSNDRSKYSLRYTGPVLWKDLNVNHVFNVQFHNIFKKQYKKILLSLY